jgi:hypothetical protein
MPLTANVQLMVTGRLTGTADQGTPTFDFALSQTTALTSGTGANQADLMWSDTRTLSASANEDLDLAAVLASVFGATLTFAEIVGVFIKASSGNTNAVRVTRPASNGFPLFVAAGDGVDIGPGGFFSRFAPDAAGIGAVTAGTGDLINVANGGGSTPVTYEIVILGRSA